MANESGNTVAIAAVGARVTSWVCWPTLQQCLGPLSLAGGVGQVPGSMADPFRQVAVSVGKNTHFSRELDPLRQLIRRAEGVAR